MKKILFIVFTVAISISIISCSKFNIDGYKNPHLEERNNIEKQVSSEKINFEPISKEEVSLELRDKINNLNDKKGYHIFDDIDKDFVYIYISSGTKMTGGYDLSVKQIEKDQNEQVIIVEENQPKEDSIVTQSLNIPYILIKTEKTNSTLKVRDINGSYFEYIN